MSPPGPSRCLRCNTPSAGEFCSPGCESAFKNDQAAECAGCRSAMGESWANEESSDVPNDARCEAHA